MPNNNYVAALSFRIGADTQQFLSGMQKFNQKASEVGAGLQRAGAYASAFTAAFTGIAVSSLSAFDKQVKAIAQVEQGLRSTGNQAGFTSQQLQQMASDLQSTTLFGDEEILQGATAQLLTFTNIAGEQFARTQQAALDLATRLDGDLKSASIQLGKALNDPVANLSALSRSGIQFSEDQKAVIKSLAETGRLAEAQTVILNELERQYGGSAAAAAAAGTGGLKQLSNSFGDLTERIGEVVYEFLEPFIKGLRNVVDQLNQADPAMIKLAVTLGGVAAAIGPVLLGVGSLIRLLPVLSAGFTAITGPVGLTVAAIAGLAALVVKYVDVFELANSVMVGDSEKTWSLLRQGAKSFYNDLLGLLASIVELPVRLYQEIYKLLGFDEAAARLDGFRGKIRSFAESMKADIDIAAVSTGNLKDNIDALDQSLKQTFASAQSTGAALSSLTGPGDLSGGGASFGQTTPIPGLQALGPSAEPKEEEAPAVAGLETGKLDEINKKLQTLGKTSGQTRTAFSQLGSTIQSSFANSEGSMKSFGKTALYTVKKVVAGFIAEGIAGIVAKSLSSAPFPIGLALGAAAGGAAAALFNSIIPKFAEGGIIRKPTLGIVGEAGPEAIVPLNNRGADFMNGLGNRNEPQELFARIDFETIYLANDRYAKRFDRNT